MAGLHCMLDPGGWVWKHQRLLCLEKVIRQEHDGNSPEDWEPEQLLAKVGATVPHGVSAAVEVGPGAMSVYTPAFLLFIEHEFRKGKASPELEEVSEASGNSVSHGFKSSTCWQECFIKTRVLFQFWVSIQRTEILEWNCFNIGKGEKAKERTSKGFLDIKWLFHKNFVMS